MNPNHFQVAIQNWNSASQQMEKRKTENETVRFNIRSSATIAFQKEEKLNQTINFAITKKANSNENEMQQNWKQIHKQSKRPKPLRVFQSISSLRALMDPTPLETLAITNKCCS